MGLIYHIARAAEWGQAQSDGMYRGNTLESEGFIHCSRRDQVLKTANRFYHGQTGLVLLTIDEAAVKPEIRDEGVPGGETFPHIYGPLNLDAVRDVRAFVPQVDGSFQLPEGWG